ncbi:MAG: cysteine desulfuration protein SufE [Psychromonas sp.]|jgi:cysteine desulfuration protein SufE
MSLDQLLSDFSENKGWDKQYRLIIQLGKKLPALTETEKKQHNQVKGCESRAWLAIEEKEGHYYLQMDSDSRVVKGLMAILLIIFQGKTAQQIQRIDIEDLFVQLGLLNHLSPSRANGLLAIVNRIKDV